MDERFSRQQFLGPQFDSLATDTEIAIAGLCGGGSHVAQQLAHIGFGRFQLFDADRAEESNTGRMVGLSAQDAAQRRLKTEVITQRILEINPAAVVVAHPGPWQSAAGTLKRCHVVFGCVDRYQPREELERFCRRYLLPYIDIGMDVHGGRLPYQVSGQVILSLPERPCMRCFGFLTDERLREEAHRYGNVGGRPQVVWPNGVLASTAVGALVQLIAPWSGEQPALYIEYDGNRHRLFPSARLAALQNHRCPHFPAGMALGDADWSPGRRVA
ncbi:thiamine/molybdopterin biosynthesis protein [Rhodanobacter thiooxydans]|uniref:Thiamine/molybdopterin biosynthesis protein n=1 Tax=Rhodanobacter thiooxydans TaxID=416169 RepID=A0A154QIM0_9GAMM|nr:ThiF family adenylyltransferase [Rhodanobacter thiooxydans]KZC24019.1 thiamine/molybdopterin biosynthesis protein [Rhodanobacter thiooxydans]